MQSRSRMLARMQKQTSRAQHRTNIRERYGLQPDMLDTGTRFYLCECYNRSFDPSPLLMTYLVTKILVTDRFKLVRDLKIELRRTIKILG